MSRYVERDYAAPVAHARTTDPETSHEAAASVTPKLRENQQAVFEAFMEANALHALTDKQLVEFYRSNTMTFFWPEQSDSGLRTRRSELVRMNILCDSGVRIRPTGRNNEIVWTVKRPS